MNYKDIQRLEEAYNSMKHLSPEEQDEITSDVDHSIALQSDSKLKMLDDMLAPYNVPHEVIAKIANMLSKR